MSRLLAAALTLLFAGAATAPAQATIVRGFTLPAMTLEAHRIVHGEVVAVDAVWDAQRQRVYTHTTVRVIDSWAGADDTEHIVVRQMGGVLDGVVTSVVGNAHLELGAEVVLFVRTDGFLHYLVGMAQGHYEVLREEGRPATVARSTAGLRRVGLRGPIRLDAPQRTRLSELEARVRGTLERAQAEVTR